MKKFYFLLILCMYCSENYAIGQHNSTNQKKRTIYIWDLTKSMIGEGWVNGEKTPNVYKAVEKVLKDDIQKFAVQDGEMRDVIIVPFQERVLTEHVMKISSSENIYVDNLIKQLEQKGPWCMHNIKHTHTNISDALEYATDNFQDPKRINRIVLLTDGIQNINGGMEKLCEVVLKWDKTQAEKLSQDQLFYILTTENAAVPHGITSGENIKIKTTQEFNEMAAQVPLYPEECNFNLLDEDHFSINLVCKNTDLLKDSKLSLSVTTDESSPLQINETGELQLASMSQERFLLNIFPDCDLRALRAKLPVGVTEVTLNLSLKPSNITVKEAQTDTTYNLNLERSQITLYIYNKERATLNISHVKAN